MNKTSRDFELQGREDRPGVPRSMQLRGLPSAAGAHGAKTFSRPTRRSRRELTGPASLLINFFAPWGPDAA